MLASLGNNHKRTQGASSLLSGGTMYLAKLWRSDKSRSYLLIERNITGRCDMYYFRDFTIMYNLSLSTFEDIVPWGIPVVGV